MRAYIVTTLIGCFGVDENNKIISFKPFPEDPVKIAGKLKTSELELIEEEKQLISELTKSYSKLVFSCKKPGVKYAEPSNQAEKYIKNNLRKLATDYGFVKDQIEFNQLLTKVNLELTKVEIKKAIGRDSLVVQASRLIEELDRSINILVERLREWYGLHFPEMDRIIPSHEKFAKLIAEFGLREKIKEPELSKFKGKSMGMDLKENDVQTIRSLANEILHLYKLREEASHYLENLLNEIAPNFTELATPMMAAKLISKAGGLEKLAHMPSSTLQLLGAERSLFRFLRGKGKSPRFGILFNHPLVQTAPNKLKGRVARAIASKLSIAAKMDYYSKKYKGEKLKKDLTERVKEILSSR